MLEYYETTGGYTRLVVGSDKTEIEGTKALHRLLAEMREEARTRCDRMKEFHYTLGKRAFYCDIVFDSMKHVTFEYNYREKEIRIGTIFDLSATF
jgi:hypothetical protein